MPFSGAPMLTRCVGGRVSSSGRNWGRSGSSEARISERTREGLARVRVSGRKLGRPKGSLGVSRLDGREDGIRRRCFLELGVSKTAVAKLTDVSRTALYSFMSTRGLGPRRPGR